MSWRKDNSHSERSEESYQCGYNNERAVKIHRSALDDLKKRFINPKNSHSERSEESYQCGYSNDRTVKIHRSALDDYFQ